MKIEKIDVGVYVFSYSLFYFLTQYIFGNFGDYTEAVIITYPFGFIPLLLWNTLAARKR